MGPVRARVQTIQIRRLDRRGLFGLPRRLFARVHNLTRSRENLRERFLLSQILVNAFGEEL